MVVALSSTVLGNTLYVSPHCLSHTQGGRTALHVATHAGHTTVVTLLNDHGSRVHAVDKVGQCFVLLYGGTTGVLS